MVPLYTRSFPWPTRLSKHVLVNPDGVVAWSKGEKSNHRDLCPFEKEGVWRWSDVKNKAVALQEDYFSKDRSGQKVNFYDDFYLPFVKKWDAAISQWESTRSKGLMRMVEGVPNEYCPIWPVPARPKNMVYVPHWYELVKLSEAGTISMRCSRSNSIR